MGDVVKFPEQVKRECTNIHTTCTMEGCPLKKLFAELGVGYYLGNCTGYLRKWPVAMTSQQGKDTGI